MTDPAVWLLAAALALAPALPLKYVSDRTMAAARDRWLLAGLAVGAVWLATRGELWLAVMAVYFLCRWRSPALLPHVITWVAVAGSWMATLAVVPRWPEAFRWALILAGVAQAGGILVSTFRAPRVFRGWSAAGTATIKRRRPTGSMGSPVLSAGFVALTLPLAPGLAWAPSLLALGATSSWLALLAVATGVSVLYPPVCPFLILLALLGALAARRRWLTWTPRDNSFQSVWARLNVGPMTWEAWRAGRWRWGCGPDTFAADGRRYRMRTGRIVPAGDAHNEVLQMAYEYGVLGLLACVLLVWRVLPHLELRDPWSAAWVVGGVLALGSYPARHVPLGVTWMVITAGVVTR